MEKATLPTLIEFAVEYIEPVLKRNTPSIILFTNEDDNAPYKVVYKEAAEAL
jgi:hypothetical protein